MHTIVFFKFVAGGAERPDRLTRQGRHVKGGGFCMGSSHMVVCSACGHHFRMMAGPGMRFLVLHCDRCGRDKGIGIDSSWPRGEEHPRAEAIAGACPCGGTFLVAAPARCPECGSDQYAEEPGDSPILFD